MRVIDANVFLLAYGSSELKDRARALLSDTGMLRAPDILAGEIANALARMTRTQSLKVAAARFIFSEALALDIELDNSSRFVRTAFELALTLNHGIFDCIYLECARHNECRLVTADAKFSQKIAATPLSRHVVHLADWRP